MWWVKGNKDPSRGGWQDRDIGRSDFDLDLGPDYGVDYAQFARPSDPTVDAKLKDQILKTVAQEMPEMKKKIDLTVKNGFVVVKGQVLDQQTREKVLNVVATVRGVKEVINQIHLSH